MAKKAETKDYIIEGRTKSGIAYRVDKRILEDSRFLYYAVGMRDSNKVKAVESMYKMYSLLFGDGDGLLLFQNEIAAAHDGICTTTLLITELNEILETVKAKN